MLTKKVKSLAIELGADLVGIAPVERWNKAPIEHSPQGILPDAKSCIVCAVHIPDACVELGGDEHVRHPGPALIQGSVGTLLNFLAFRLAKYLQEQGYKAIAVPSTGFWTYRPRKGAPRGWIGDICHFYAAVCAGLGEIGWHNICITPEFGPRQRFISIITDAPLEPDPMYKGETLCDKCMLCAKHCPTKSFDKEVSGMCEIEIEDRKFSFPNRNLWRCAILENFQLDASLPFPDKIDEKVIIEMEEKAVKEHPEWVHGWNMGTCLKYCVPPARRYFDKEYCKSPRRKRDVAVKEKKTFPKKLITEILDIAEKTGVDIIGSADIKKFKNEGIDIKSYLPDAESVIVIGLGYPENCYLGTDPLAAISEIRITNRIEKYGFSVLAWSELPADISALICEVAKKNEEGKIITTEFGERQVWRAIITSASSTKPIEKKPSPRLTEKTITPTTLTKEIKEVAKNEGAELIGIAPIERINKIVGQLEKIINSEKDYFVVEDAGWEIKGINIWGGQAMPYNPKPRNVKLSPKKPQDYLSTANSVIVIGVHLIEASIDYVGKPLAEKAGHYYYSVHYEVFNQISCILLKVAKTLDKYGYKAYPSFDLCNLASRVLFGNVDLTASRFEAIAAGLGEIGWNGIVLTPEFGPRQRFAVIITDAVLEYDSVYKGATLCKRCFKCVDSCPVRAISKDESWSIEIDGKKFQWGKTDRLRCDWAKRYGLVGDEGPKFMGSYNNFTPPQNITPESICEAIQKSDRIQRPTGYSAIVEGCFINCPVRAANQK